MRHSWRLGELFVTCALALAVTRPAMAEEATDVAPVAATHGDAPVTLVLHADTPRATLERRASVETYAGLPIKDASIAGIATWTPECTSPCEAKLDPKYTYRIGGDGLVPSSSFVLPHGEGPVVVDAKMGSALGRLGGLGLSAAGAGGMILGATAVAVTPILAQDNVGTEGVRTGVLASGIAVATLSALVFGAGLWLWSHSETTVHPNQMRGFVF
jgi:hypothetical protein